MQQVHWGPIKNQICTNWWVICSQVTSDSSRCLGKIDIDQICLWLEGFDSCAPGSCCKGECLVLPFSAFMSLFCCSTLSIAFFFFSSRLVIGQLLEFSNSPTSFHHFPEARIWELITAAFVLITLWITQWFEYSYWTYIYLKVGQGKFEEHKPLNYAPHR